MTSPLADLKSRLALLREMGVAVYSRDGDKESVTFFPPSMPLVSRGAKEEYDDAGQRAESQAAFERRVSLGASGGLRIQRATAPDDAEARFNEMRAKVRRERQAAKAPA